LRIVVFGGTGVTGFIGIAKLFLRPANDDVVATAQIVRDSDRNWTIVRPPFLKNGRSGVEWTIHRR
jgi:hypothetical protein